jgi:hypothetical protein
MADLTLDELKLADQKKLNDLLRHEASQMFGSTSYRVDPLPPKDRQPRTYKRLVTFLMPFRKLFRTS